MDRGGAAALASFRRAWRSTASGLRPSARRNQASERTVETDWTPVEGCEKLAETCARYLHTGRCVRITRSLHTHSWADRVSSQKRFNTVVRPEEIGASKR